MFRKPSGRAAQTLTHVGETGGLQVTQEEILFKGVPRRTSDEEQREDDGEDEELFIRKQQCD